MAIPLNVTIDEWVFEAIEMLKRKNKRSRSETVNELLTKGILLAGAVNKD